MTLLHRLERLPYSPNRDYLIKITKKNRIAKSRTVANIIKVSAKLLENKGAEWYEKGGY